MSNSATSQMPWTEDNSNSVSQYCWPNLTTWVRLCSKLLMRLYCYDTKTIIRRDNSYDRVSIAWTNLLIIYWSAWHCRMFLKLKTDLKSRSDLLYFLTVTGSVISYSLATCTDLHFRTRNPAASLSENMVFRHLSNYWISVICCKICHSMHANQSKVSFFKHWSTKFAPSKLSII